ncbi:MAG TPA: glycosyltransferase family 2 protein [Vicinamibacterales bacterium]|nr:glycosyltransferase family 2 protein [Vicinamibacterales bacterium]
MSVVLPAYNEEPGIEAAVREFAAVDAVDEVLVVNNRSTDRTEARALAAGARVVREEDRQGYGAALTCGLRHAVGDLIILAEPDGTFVARDVHKLLAYADEFDMVCGTRTTPQLIWDGANMGFALRWGNTLLAKVIEFVYGGPSLSDCGCTLRLIHRPAWDRLDPHMTVTGSHFLPEMVILGLRLRLRLLEVPVNYRSRKGQSKITGTWRGTVTTALRMAGLIVGHFGFRPR